MSRDWLKRRLTHSAVFSDGVRRVRGDHDLNPGLRAHKPLRRAAVLVALVTRPAEPCVLLIQRAPRMAEHPGEIGFPGGKVAPEDADTRATALREAGEEVGLCASKIDVLGQLDDQELRSGYLVTPVVGLVDAPLALSLNRGEVAEAFEIPLGFVLDRRNHRKQRRHDGQSECWFYVMEYRQRTIWGATANMLVDLAERFADA